MGLFAMGDTHLGFAVDKPMDRFGENWVNHSQRILTNWQENILPTDTVILAGDISWGMSEAEGAVDLEWIDALPGKKIILEGNHDYWWKSTSKMERRFPNMKFLKNSHERYEDWFICGARGWLCPNDSYFKAEDRKIYEREQIRLRLSLESAMRMGAEKIILAMHFPLTNDKHEPSGFTEIVSQYPVKHVVYGHLHGKDSHKVGLQGQYEGAKYRLVSADYVDFMPVQII